MPLAAESDVFCGVLNQVAISGGNMACFQGGVLIKDTSGEIVGSVGVSGAAGDEDEFTALTGIRGCSIGESLMTEPLEHSCEHGIA